MTRLTPTLVFQKVSDDRTVLLDESTGQEIEIPTQAMPALAQTALHFQPEQDYSGICNRCGGDLSRPVAGDIWCHAERARRRPHNGAEVTELRADWVHPGREE